MTSTPVEQLAQVLADTERLVAAVRDEQWADPTPCTDWDVRRLVNHLVVGNRAFASILRGQELSREDVRRLQAEDALGDKPVAAYRAAADALLAALIQPGVLDRVVTVPIGPAPGIVALHLRMVETLVHGWDLARATGQEPRFPDDIVERELEFTRDQLAGVPADRSPFAPPTPVPGDAPAIDRLAACLGRPATATAD
ncbi:TIGR03086 family metal-binding protein [Nonomuraea sp. NPDC000554]|uniref:TIGR03086 family metal-binding protein n=1 Tax=Nonomuraea sp. NPDC000554 TaxID=3154259 RepID=UPI003316D13D